MATPGRCETRSSTRRSRTRASPSRATRIPNAPGSSRHGGRGRCASSGGGPATGECLELIDAPGNGCAGWWYASWRCGPTSTT